MVITDENKIHQIEDIEVDQDEMSQTEAALVNAGFEFEVPEGRKS